MSLASNIIYKKRALECMELSLQSILLVKDNSDINIYLYNCFL